MSRSRRKGDLPEDRNRRRQANRASRSPGSDAAMRDSGSPAAPRPARRDLYAALAVCALLVLAVAVVFAQTVNFEFVNYDDDKYVYENPHVRGGVTAAEIAWAFTSSRASNWHPLTWLSHAIDCDLYRLHAGGHHLTNVVLHALTAVVLFLVLWRMTFSLWPSAFVAAVFAVHPLRVESVAWIAERKDVLSGLFFMLTLWAYLGYVRHPVSLLRYLSVIVLFALGLMSKPMLVTMPFVLLLLDYWPLGRISPRGGADIPVCREKPPRDADSGRQECLPHQSSLQQSHRSSLPQLIIEKVPLLLLAAASCVVTLWSQQNSVVRLNELSPLSRLGNVLVSYVAYLGQFFYPLDLAVFYPHPAASLPTWKAVAALLLLLGISLAGIVRRRRNPYLFVGWFWYLGMLVPVIGLVQVGLQGMADRYSYLPQIGLTIAVTWSAVAVGQTFLSAGKNVATGGQTFLSAEKIAGYHRWVCGIASALLLMGLMACAWRQTSFWQNSETLWTQTLRCTSRNDVAHFNLADELMRQQRYGEAIEQYEETVRIRPRYPRAQYNLAFALWRQGQMKEAILHYYEALKNDPDDRLALNNLAWLLATCPQAALRDGAEAVKLAQRAVRLCNGREVLNIGTLAAAYAEAGRFPEAVQAAHQAIDQAKRQNNRALAEDTQARLRLYMAKTPYHEPAPASPERSTISRAADWVSISILSQPDAPLVKKGDPGTENIKHGFETGCVLKLDGVYQWFTAEFPTDPLWVKTRLTRWASRDGRTWKRIGTLYESSGSFDGGDPRAALFAPMPIYNEKDGRWDLFYSSARCKPNTATEWLNNYDMRIWRAVSQTPGRRGFAGPYKDVGVILQPGKDSGKWEGLQGVDSFFPYRVGSRWYAFHGSAKTESRPMSWMVGLATAPELSGPWRRLPERSPVVLDKPYDVENPIVLRLKSGRFIAVFDTLSRPLAIGYTVSEDGIRWSQASYIEAETHAKSLGWRYPHAARVDRRARRHVHLFLHRLRHKRLCGLRLFGSGIVEIDRETP